MAQKKTGDGCLLCTSAIDTHESYFHTYKVSAEQYGEILAALAFDGKKMGNANPGYDVEAQIKGQEARIEVKSKVFKNAQVVHCGPNKLKKGAMTHLLVVLVDPKNSPSVKEAWLLTRRQAKRLRRTDTKSEYINVGDIRRSLTKRLKGILLVTVRLQRAAQSRI